MDKFKAKMTEKCAVGGLKCRCCNPFHEGKDKAKLRRMARRTLKQAFRNRKDK